jgi:hypothetical protein
MLTKINKNNLLQFSFHKTKLKYLSKLMDVDERSRDDDYYWKKPLFESYVYLLEFPENILLYRMYIFNPSNTRFLIEISDNKNKDFTLFKDEVQCKKDSMKVINFGFLPIKYIKFTTLNKEPFVKSNQIKCYGFNKNYLIKKFEKDNLNIFFDNAIDIIYNKENL